MQKEALNRRNAWEPSVFYSLGNETFSFTGQEISIRESLDSFGAVIWPGVRKNRHYQGLFLYQDSLLPCPGYRHSKHRITCRKTFNTCNLEAVLTPLFTLRCYAALPFCLKMKTRDVLIGVVHILDFSTDWELCFYWCVENMVENQVGKSYLRRQVHSIQFRRSKMAMAFS